MADDSITIRIASLRDVNAEAFLDAFRDTIATLHELNRAVSEFGAVNLEWRIVDAGLKSPIFATLKPFSTSKDNGHYGPKVISAFVDGLQSLAEGDKPPKLFSETALRLVAGLDRTRSRGVTAIEFSADSRKATASKTVVKHASQAAGRLELERVKRSGKYVEYGTLEGQLKGLESQSGRDKLVIVDQLTGTETRCYISDATLDKVVRENWKHSVAVHGTITVDRLTGEPEEMRVEELTPLRERSALPQIEDLDGIDITGGIESSEYVRGLRDGD